MGGWWPAGGPHYIGPGLGLERGLDGVVCLSTWETVPEYGITPAYPARPKAQASRLPLICGMEDEAMEKEGPVEARTGHAQQSKKSHLYKGSLVDIFDTPVLGGHDRPSPG